MAKNSKEMQWETPDEAYKRLVTDKKKKKGTNKGTEKTNKKGSK